MKTYRVPNIDTSVHISLIVVNFAGYIVEHILDIMMSLCRHKQAKKLKERQARVNGPSAISSTLTCSYCTRETNDHIGLKSHKRRKLSNMTIAADWGVKPQIKQISPENLPHGRLKDKNKNMLYVKTPNTEGNISNFKAVEYQTVETIA